MPRPGDRIPMPDRITALVLVLPNGCWEWQGTINRDGYARLELRQGIGRSTRRRVPAHVAAYGAFVGPVPAGRCLDHLCHTNDASCAGGFSCPHRRCVNPTHLEPVTQRVNTLRGRTITATNAAKTHCVRGHELAGDNLRITVKGGRICRLCVRTNGRRHDQKRRMAVAS